MNIKSNYSIPNIRDFSSKLSGMKYFSTLDLTKAYWQVPVGLWLRAKTAILTPFGCFQFTVMLFGIKNAGSTFQRMIDTIITGLPYIYV